MAVIPEEVQAIDLPNGISLLRVGFSFRTAAPNATCHAAFKFLRLLNGDLKIFTTTTSLKAIDAAPWKDCKRTTEVSKELPNETEALIVGAGCVPFLCLMAYMLLNCDCNSHAGLALAAYLQALDIDFAIVDREEQVGDAWAKRYDSATLHTSRVFSGLPYRPFPEDYPEYINAKQLAQFYKSYAKDLNLPIYQSTDVQQALWDDTAKKWTVKTSRGTIVTRSLIFAIGIGGRYPVRPDYPNEECFKGEVLHSVSYTNPEKWIGKRVVVIGAATTGLDVAWDCSRLGIKTTVVQRGATRIYAPGHITQVQKRFWNDSTGAEYGDIISTEDAVVLNACLSNLVMKMQKEAHDQAYYDGLAKAGFLAQNEGAVHNQIFCRVGRHYPDIGAGEAIINGEFAIKSGASVTGFTPEGLAFDDGTHLEADVVCFCTGFKKDNRDIIADIIGEDIKLEPVWNLDKEGEIRGVFRPTGHDGIWIQGGELQTMRYYGKFLSLQIAAVLRGVRPQPVRL